MQELTWDKYEKKFDVENIDLATLSEDIQKAKEIWKNGFQKGFKTEKELWSFLYEKYHDKGHELLTFEYDNHEENVGRVITGEIHPVIKEGIFSTVFAIRYFSCTIDEEGNFLDFIDEIVSTIHGIETPEEVLEQFIEEAKNYVD